MENPCPADDPINLYDPLPRRAVRNDDPVLDSSKRRWDIPPRTG